MSKTRSSGIRPAKLSRIAICGFRFPILLCGFSVWLYWGMVAKVMQRLHFADNSLFNFTFMNSGRALRRKRLSRAAIHVARGRRTGRSDAANSQLIYDRDLRRPQRQVHDDRHADHTRHRGRHYAAATRRRRFGCSSFGLRCRVSGAAHFASSMSNISFFFPKRMQGLALGLNAGLGNAGVSVMQFLIPWVITFGLFGGLGGDPQEFVQDGQTKQNCGFKMQRLSGSRS